MATPTDPALTQAVDKHALTGPDVVSGTTTAAIEIGYLPRNVAEIKQTTIDAKNEIMAYLKAQTGIIDGTTSDLTIAGLRSGIGAGKETSFRPNETRYVSPLTPPWLILHFPPIDPTEAQYLYIINTARKLRLFLYADTNPNLTAALNTRMAQAAAGTKPFDYQLLLNHDSYTDTPGAENTLLDSKNADGSWKYPYFHNNPNVRLGRSTYNLGKVTPGVDASGRIIHTKGLIADDQVVVIGSTNWGDSDNNKQAQAQITIVNPGAVDEFQHEFDRTWNLNLTRGDAYTLIPA